MLGTNVAQGAVCRMRQRRVEQSRLASLYGLPTGEYLVVQMSGAAATLAAALASVVVNMLQPIQQQRICWWNQGSAWECPNSSMNDLGCSSG
jgi:hypothetical protein